MSGRSEAWDAPLYWPVTYPLCLLLAGVLAYFEPVRPWRWALAVMLIQPLVMLLTSGSSLSLLPLAMRMAGPREAVWHAIIRRNYGASHLIVGRDHASPGVDSAGRPFYGQTDAQKLAAGLADETGVQILAFNEFAYLPDEDRYEELDQIEKGKRVFSLSGTEIRDGYLSRGRELPSWFTRPSVAAILTETYPPKHKQGVCVWFTGLSGSGKSTTAEILVARLLESGRRVVERQRARFLHEPPRVQVARGLVTHARELFAQPHGCK